MPRSQGNPHPSFVSRILMFFTKRALRGREIVGMRIRAFDPQYLRYAARLDMYSAAQGTVPMHLKELAQLKVAMMVGCPF